MDRFTNPLLEAWEGSRALATKAGSYLTNKIYNDDEAARAHLEEQLWPDGPVCPHCQSNAATALAGKAHRKGLYQCNECREQFSVTVGTVFERSKISLAKWVLAAHLMAASKKGMSSKQFARMLGVSYKTRVVRDASHSRGHGARRQRWPYRW